MKVARISNRPAKLNTAKLKTAAQKHVRLNLWNRFECLQLDEIHPWKTNGESSKTRSQTLLRHT